MPDSNRFLFLLGTLLVLTSTGCVRKSEPVFAVAKSGEELPANQQKQIHDALHKYFGTPANPLLKTPATEPNEAGEIVLTDITAPDHLKYGAEVFARRCAGCHGETGDGAGEAAAYLQPKPRDYRKGIFKFTSSPYGSKPVRNDLLRVILLGSKGTSMPSFKFLPEEELQALIDYVIMISCRGEVEEALAYVAANDYDAEDEIDAEDFSKAVTRVHEKWTEAQYEQIRPLTSQPKMTDETIRAGRAAFLSRGCSKCHGTDAKGQTAWLSPKYIAAQEAKPEAEREKINRDAWGNPAPAADLTAGMLHGGRRPIDIYRRIYSGINGTPMPGFAAAFSKEPDTIWHLVHYVLSVVDAREVEGLADVKADPVPETDAPTDPPADAPAEATETPSAEPSPATNPAEATEASDAAVPATASPAEASATPE